MKFRYLAKIGDSYDREEGTTGHRIGELNKRAAEYQAALLTLQNLRKPTTCMTGRPAEIAKTSVKDRANFFQANTHNDLYKKTEEARANVERLRQWIVRQGGFLKADGSIDWSKDNSVVVYDHQASEQGLTKLHFSGQKAFMDSACTKPFDTTSMVTCFSGPGKAIFVMSESGNIHVSSHSVGNRHHSSLLAGQNVACAGELEAKNGKIVWLSNKSGHYRPKLFHLVQVLHQLQKRGMPMTFQVEWRNGTAVQTSPNVAGFLHAIDAVGERDYELAKLMAYKGHLNSSVLQRNRWRFSVPPEKDGVYEVGTNQAVPHKVVRTWLKANGYQATTDLQSGAGR